MKRNGFKMKLKHKPKNSGLRPLISKPRWSKKESRDKKKRRNGIRKSRENSKRSNKNENRSSLKLSSKSA